MLRTSGSWPSLSLFIFIFPLPFHPVLVHQVQLDSNLKEMEKMKSSISKRSCKDRNETLGGVGHSPFLEDSSSVLRNVFIFIYKQHSDYQPPQIQASNSLPWSQWLYLHESLKKGKSSAVSSKFSCAGRWVGDSVTGWCLRLCCIFHSRAGGLLTLTSHSSMATSFPKYRKSLVTADIRGSCSQSAPTTSSAFKPCRFYNIAN